MSGVHERGVEARIDNIVNTISNTYDTPEQAAGLARAIGEVACQLNRIALALEYVPTLRTDQQGEEQE